MICFAFVGRVGDITIFFDESRYRELDKEEYCECYRECSYGSSGPGLIVCSYHDLVSCGSFFSGTIKVVFVYS